jgi:hypothetical protein
MAARRGAISTTASARHALHSDRLSVGAWQSSAILEALLAARGERAANLGAIRVDGAGMYVRGRAVVNAGARGSGFKCRLPKMTWPDVIQNVEAALALPAQEVLGGD